MNHIVGALLTIPGFAGVVLGAGLAPLYRTVKAEVAVLWRAFCRFAARMHVKQTTLDDGAINLIDRARPAINNVLDDARAGLVAERATAAALEEDAVQNGSLAPKPVDAAPLAAPAIAAVAVVAAP